MKARAVVLCPRLPWPPDDGGRIALWQTVWSAAQEFDTVLLCMVPKGTESHPLPKEILDLGIQVQRVPHTPPPLPVAALRGLFGRWPYTLARFRNPLFAKAVSELAISWKPGFFFVNHLHLATYWDSMRGVPMILREQNLEYLWMERFAAGLSHGPIRWYASAQAQRLRKVEAEFCRKSALVFAITVNETEALRKLMPGARVETLPVGIDVSAYGPPSPSALPVVLLAGAFDWRPNADGAIRFLLQGWPRVRREVPGARLRIAGRMPPRKLFDVAREGGAETTGYVDDMREEFRRSTALVVPLWVGAGARVKIIEAMASGLPVASTPIGAEGLGLSTGEDYVEGDTPEELAEQLISLLHDSSLRARLSAAGTCIARERWSLRSVADIQNSACRSVGITPVTRHK